MDPIVQIEKEIEAKNWSHAYLFSGDNDYKIGEAIKLLVNGTSALQEDISTVKAEEEKGKAGEIKIEAIRKLLHELYLSPFGPVRIGLIYNAERLNQSSANILLKTLEEPPERAIIVLISKNLEILETIRSRCRVMKFNSEKRQDHTFSYEDVLKGNLAVAFKQIEDIVKTSQIEQFLLELEKYFEEKMIVEKDARAGNLLKLILETNRRIKKNANARLILENLILKARSI